MTNNTEVMQNDVSGDVYASQIETALRDTVDILSTHCGPFARNAIIPSKATTKNDLNGMSIDYVVDRFTKDGISIIRSLSTKSPAHKYALRQVKYVGNCVDKACHDGTTTSMMFTGLIMLGVMETLKQNYVSRLDLSNRITQLIDGARRHIKKSTITVDELVGRLMGLGFTERESLYAVYFNQAMITSKRDRKLSHAVAEAAMSIPKELMGHFTYRRCAYETKEAFIIEEHDYQMSFRAEIDQQFNNVSMGTAIKYDNVDVFITPNVLSPESNETKMLLSMLGHPAFPRKEWGNLKPFEETLDKPLLIIAHQNTAHLLGDEIEKWNAKHKDRPIIFVQMLAMNRTQQLLSDTMAAIAGKDMGAQDRPMEKFYDSIIHDVAFRYENRTAYFSNLFDASGFHHPFYKDKSKLFYHRTLEHLLDIIDRFKKSHHKGAENQRQSELSANLVRQMILSRITDLMIGGNIINNVAAIHAVEDSLGSVLSVIENGMVLGGYFKLIAGLRSAAPVNPKNITGRMVAFYVLEKAAEEILKVTYTDRSNPFTLVKDPDFVIRKVCMDILYNHVSYHNLQDKWTYAIPAKERDHELMSYHSLDDEKSLRDLVLVSKTDLDFTALLQPAMCFIEQLNRIEEIIPHFINSERLLDTGIDDETL